MYHATAKKMEELDFLAVEEGLQIRQMMELAGYHMVALFVAQKISIDSHITVVCGRGNKGGDGLSASRHLFNNGYQNISIILESSNHLKADSVHHLELLKKMNIPIFIYADSKEESERKIAQADVLIESLIGYHLDGAPSDRFADLISRINDAKGRVISYDLPSGVDVNSGNCEGVCVDSYATLMLALPKKLLETEEGKKHSGIVYLADIGIPSFLYDRIEQGSRPAFAGRGLILI